MSGKFLKWSWSYFSLFVFFFVFLFESSGDNNLSNEGNKYVRKAYFKAYQLKYVNPKRKKKKKDHRSRELILKVKHHTFVLFTETQGSEPRHLPQSPTRYWHTGPVVSTWMLYQGSEFPYAPKGIAGEVLKKHFCLSDSDGYWSFSCSILFILIGILKLYTVCWPFLKVLESQLKLP